MKKVNRYWVDENNNKWDSFYTTEEQAEIYSRSLIKCISCISCAFCTSCTSCTFCISCNDCRNCRNCRNCIDCRDCSDCRDYIENPSRYVTKKIGSRKDNTTFYYGKTKDGMSLQVVCGCFRGNLEELEKAVEETHKDNKYAKEYKIEIEKVKVLFDLGKKENKRERKQRLK